LRGFEKEKPEGMIYIKNNTFELHTIVAIKHGYIFFVDQKR